MYPSGPMLPAASTARMAKYPLFFDAGTVIVSFAPEAPGTWVTVTAVAEPTVSWVIGAEAVNSW